MSEEANGVQFHLDGKAFVTLLINMTESTGVIVGMITHCLCATNPAHKPAHFAVNQKNEK